MEAGDKITFPFGKGQKEGVVVRIHDKSVLLRVEFPRHRAKLIRRKIHELESRGEKKKPAKNKKK